MRSAIRHWPPEFSVDGEFPVASAGHVQTQRRADVAVVEYHPHNGTVKRVNLIVECKLQIDSSGRARRQLFGYMRDTKCIYGILMTATIAHIYKDNGGEDLDEIEMIFLNTDQGIIKIQEFINSLRYM